MAVLINFNYLFIQAPNNFITILWPWFFGINNRSSICFMFLVSNVGAVGVFYVGSHYNI